MSGRVKKPQLILVEPRWVVARPSSDVIAVDDRDVAAAAAYIRDNARRRIGVEDVVKHSAVSRRGGNPLPPHARTIDPREIERIRVGRVKQLLVETNLPVRKIAETRGLPTGVT